MKYGIPSSKKLKDAVKARNSSSAWIKINHVRLVFPAYTHKFQLKQVPFN